MFALTCAAQRDVVFRQIGWQTKYSLPKTRGETANKLQSLEQNETFPKTWRFEYVITIHGLDSVPSCRVAYVSATAKVGRLSTRIFASGVNAEIGEG